MRIIASLRASEGYELTINELDLGPAKIFFFKSRTHKLI